MSWYGDPDALERVAVRLAGEAERVRGHVGRLRVTPSRARWRGPAADVFAASVRHEAVALARAAGELDDAAAALRAHAATVRHELARIHTAEHAVTAWLAGAVHAVSDLPERLGTPP